MRFSTLGFVIKQSLSGFTVNQSPKRGLFDKKNPGGLKIS
jgi:hypothetical protein